MNKNPTPAPNAKTPLEKKEDDELCVGDLLPYTTPASPEPPAPPLSNSSASANMPAPPRAGYSYGGSILYVCFFYLFWYGFFLGYGFHNHLDSSYFVVDYGLHKRQKERESLREPDLCTYHRIGFCRIHDVDKSRNKRKILVDYGVAHVEYQDV